MQKLKGKLTISSPSGGLSEKDIVRIEILDVDASCYAVLVEMEIEIFARALMGHGHMDCVFEFNDSGNVGTISQNKEETVPVPADSYRNLKAQKLALAPFEVDGWKARAGDIDNHHRASQDKSGQRFQLVVFFRNVPREQPE